jgi:hypothetical protein
MTILPFGSSVDVIDGSPFWKRDVALCIEKPKLIPM